MKFKKDQKVVGGLKDGNATILYVHEGDAYALPSYLIQYEGGGAHLLTADYVERNFRPVPDFYELGKRYAFDMLNGPKYYVSELHEYGDKQYALTKVTEQDGRQRMSLLNSGHFADMKEVK